MDNDLNIKITSSFESANEMKKKLMTELKKVNANLDIKVNLDSKNISFKGIEDESKKVKKRIEKDFQNPIKFNSKISGQGYDELKARVQDIKKEVNSLAKVSINTDKNGNMLSATIHYKDEIGKTIKETMKWIDTNNKAGDSIKRVFQTTGLTFVQDIDKANKKVEKSTAILDRYETQLKKIKSDSGLSIGVKDEGSLTKINSEYEKLMSTINELKGTKLDLGQQSDLQKQIADFKLLTRELADSEKVIGSGKGVNFKNYKDVTNEMVKLKNISDAHNTSLLKGHEVLKSSVQETSTYATVTQKLKVGDSIKDISVHIDKATGKMYQFRDTVENSEKSVNSLASHVKAGLGAVGSEIFGGTALSASVNAIKSGIKSIIDIDTAMTDLKKVTNETDLSYNQFIGTANSMAISLGHSTEAVINATTDFAKLGYSFKQSQELAKSAIVYSNTGDIDINSATEGIISTLKGFKLEAESTTRVIDVLNEVGNNFAITSGGIGEALKRSASSLSESGNSLEESVSLITTANSSIQSAEKVGTAMKTISMRLRGISEESGEAIPKLRETIKLITGNKVDIMLNDDTFKSTFEIMKELSKVYDTLTDKNKAYLQELVAGKMHGKCDTLI